MPARLPLRAMPAWSRHRDGERAWLHTRAVVRLLHDDAPNGGSLPPPLGRTPPPRLSCAVGDATGAVARAAGRAYSLSFPMKRSTADCTIPTRRTTTAPSTLATSGTSRSTDADTTPPWT